VLLENTVRSISVSLLVNSWPSPTLNRFRLIKPILGKKWVAAAELYSIFTQTQTSPMKRSIALFLFIVFSSFVAEAQCTLANYMAAVRIPIASFPYVALSAPALTVSAINSGAPTLGNSSYNCGAELYGGASPAWWLNGAAQSLTFNFTSPVTSLTFLINGTNATEVFNIVSNSTCAISLSNFCSVGFTSVGGTLTAGPTAGLGSIITVNNPGGATQYVMTHNGLGAGSRVTLLDCFVKGTGTCVLPIELSEFKGQCRYDNVVELNWTTMNEYSNDYFTIEKSIDSEEWNEIGRVKGAGMSTNRLNYAFRDENNSAAVTYYRLKQTDFNKKYTYSEIINLPSCKEKGKGEIMIYPNPANQELTIKADIEGITAGIYNFLGEEIIEMKLIRGENKLDISSIPNGTYYIKSSSENSEIKVRKLVISR